MFEEALPEVLLVDDNPADIDLTTEALATSKRRFRVNFVTDGSEAVSFLRHTGKYAASPVADLVLLDLNLPRKDGRAVLSDIKSDPEFARTPIVVFTTSKASSDIARSYELGANCYFCKPANLPDFMAAVQSMADFWLGHANLPPKERP